MELKSQINKIVELLTRQFIVSIDNALVYKLSAYIAILFSLKVTEKNLLPAEYNALQLTLKNKYPHLVDTYCKIHSIIDKEAEGEICLILSQISYNDEYAEFVLSDIYQQIKAHLLATLRNNEDSSVAKIEGRHLLHQTQFFTDSYMVKFLVEQVFAQYNDLHNVLFVDPASGGGNFLIYIFRRLAEWYHQNGEENIAKLIFENNILGYDLDAQLAEIASLSLFLNARSLGLDCEDCIIYNYGGLTDDENGFIANRILSNKIAGKSFEDAIRYARALGKHIVYITNPPFMGKRDLSTPVKNYLLKNYKSAKGDLCFSFMLKILRSLQNGDYMAVVAQNGWLSLSSLKDYRRIIMNNFQLLLCADLGSNAFKNINGEKTNVVLAIFTKHSDRNSNSDTLFINLRHKPLLEKEYALRKREYSVYKLPLSAFAKNKNLEFNYQLGEDIPVLSKYKTYGEYARCMQGSSTGDNQTMVKYIWQTNASEWKLASKGGGFSKWIGLNIYKVNWGKEGEAIKQQKGGVLRNPTQMRCTSLVFSDTGTLGLNIRHKLHNQVFIASGPGIKVLSGDEYCHMAFLNSKMAAFFMKIINPKFTVSGGYIQKLPIADNILDNFQLSALAMICVDLKKTYLATKVPNVEFMHRDYDDIGDVYEHIVLCLERDLHNMHERLVAERMIDDIIFCQYHLSKRLSDEYQRQMGSLDVFPDKLLDIESIDDFLAKSLSPNCMIIAKRPDGRILGSENGIELLCCHYHASISSVLRSMTGNFSRMHKTLCIYKKDFLHKMILKLFGITKLDNVGHTIQGTVKGVYKLLLERYPSICRQLALTEKDVAEVLNVVHTKVFMNAPIIIAK